MVNASEFPLPDVLLNNSSGVYDPQVITTEFQNQTIYELAYGQSTPAAGGLSATNTIQYLDGRYDPATAICILNRSGCGSNVSHLPIAWGAPWKIFALGAQPVLQGLALGASSGLVATAFSSNNRTRLLYTYDFGERTSWTNPTPTTVPGVQPKLSVSPTAIMLTTVSPSGGTYVTVFHIPNLPSPTPLIPGGSHHPGIPPPTVTSANPYYGPAGSTVDVYGSNYASVTAVTFGAHAATSFTVLSTTHLQATVPGFSSTLPVNITVTTGSGTSATNSPYDWFTISSTAPQPRIVSVVPDYALPNTTVTVVGYGFVASQSVAFGSTTALGSAYTNETYFNTTVPWGVGGPVDLSVTALGQQSLLGPTDHFTYAVSQAILPLAIDASPALLTNGASGTSIFGVFATDKNSSQTRLYNSTNGGTTYSNKALASFSTSVGSSIFSRIGATRLFLGGGNSGQVAAVGFGQTIFALFTSNLGNRTVVETEGSSDGGQTWNGPYYTAPLLGSVSAPYATISPAGLVYVAWVDNGAGPWQVDQTVFTESGRLLLGPQTISGSGGPSGYSAIGPTVAVDGLDRPLFIWGWTNQPACGPCLHPSTTNLSIMATGAYLNASNAASELSNAFHRTVPTDFIPQDFLWTTSRSQNLTPFENKVNARIGWFQANLSAARPTCTLQKLAVRYVLPNVSSIAAAAPFFGVPGHCSTSPASPVTQVANLVGATSANRFLGVYADWLLEAVGYGSLKEPAWIGTPDQSQLQRNFHLTAPPLHLPSNQQTNATGTDWHVAVAPLSLNPNSIYLNTSGFFSTVQSGTSGLCLPNLQHTPSDLILSDIKRDYPTWANETVKVQQLAGGSYSGTFHPSGWMPSAYITKLPSGFWGSYTLTLNVTYQEFESRHDGCDPNNSSLNFQNRSVTPFSLNPHYVNLSLVGNLTTYLEGVPADLVVHEVGNVSSGNATIYSAWNNSVMANYTEWTNGTNVSKRLTSNPFGIASTTGPISVAANHWYNTTANLVSVPGGFNASGWVPRLNTGISGNSSAERFNATSPWTCAYRLPSTNPVVIYSNSQALSGVSTSNATLTWWSNYDGVGWVSYNDSDDGVFSLPAQKINLSAYPSLISGHTGEPVLYTVQLHGLTPWALYRASVGVSGNGSGTFSGGGSCLTFANTVQWHFHTLSLFPIEEQDLPYDSVARQGGGAQFRWSIPTAFAAAAIYHNGTMSYCQWWTNRTPQECAPGSNVTIPLPALTAELAGANFGFARVNSSFVLNSTGLTPNTQYNATLRLNFSYSGVPFNATSRPLVFWYEKDTSGDGLTDWEKIHGWEVTTLSANGQWNSPSWVTANPNLYATNGLTNDLVEKEFSLNPSTVDTASSHMLDTWNLTFDLGPIARPLSVPVGTNFQYWYEQTNGSAYNWNTTCQYFLNPGAGPCKLRNATNALGLSNITGADSSAWAARALWSRAALGAFIGLAGVKNASWLRAVLGNDNQSWTLTVEGKLSWGANPLATSTPKDGTSDGSRVDPLYEEALQVGGLTAGLSACVKAPNVGGGYGSYGWAVAFYLNQSSTAGSPELGGPGGSGTPPWANYSVQSFDNSTDGVHGCGTLAGYSVLIPIGSTTQNQSLQVRILLNQSPSSSSTNLVAQKISSSSPHTTFSVIYDTVAGRRTTYSSSGMNGSVTFNLSVVIAGMRAPTLLWLPTLGSTLTNLPWGLKRYTGEQSFDLVEVNSTGTQTAIVPNPQNSSKSYEVSLSAGLNNLLIPRQQFLFSTLGEAVLLGRNGSWKNSSATAPMLNSSAKGVLGAYGPANLSSNPLRNLACYWQNRSINNTTGGSICSQERGANWRISSSNLATVVFASANGTNTGGLPGEPGLESASESGAAIQSIFTLNITNNTNLVLLLAGLLDNSTGGVNGSFLGVTSEVPSLDLSPIVVNALANTSYVSLGFGKHSPWGKVPPAPPPPPCTGSFCWISNSVAGIVRVAGTLYSYPWSSTVAISTFVNDHLPTWLKNLGGQLASRVASALVTLGNVILGALNAFLNYLITLVDNLLSPLTNTITGSVNRYTLNLASDLEQTYNDTALNRSINGDAYHFWADVEGALFIVAEALALAVTVAITLVESFSLGAGFLVGIAIGLLLTGGAAGLAAAGGPSLLADFEGINPISTGLAEEWQDLFDPPDYLGTLGELLGISTTSFAAQSIEVAWDNGELPEWTDEASLALGFVGIVVAGAAGAFSSTAGAVASLFFDGSSIILDIISLAHEFSLMNIISALIDASTVLIDAHTLGLPI